MKVFNITDAATSALTNQGLANQAIKIGDTVIPNGGSAEIRGTAKERSELQVFIKVGAVAIDELPPAYAARRGLLLDGRPIVAPKELEELKEEVDDKWAPDSAPSDGEES